MKLLDRMFHPMYCRIRNRVHRTAMWESNAARQAAHQLRIEDIGYMPAPVLVERWTPPLGWRVAHWWRRLRRATL